MYYEIINCIT